MSDFNNPAADVSPIQSSSDVTVTDTQTGTVSDGEFLTNSGGSLTGGTVQTEPNVPPWEEEATSPTAEQLSAGQTETFDITTEYNIIKVHASLKATDFGGTTFNLTANGITSNEYRVAQHDGTQSTSEPSIELATVDNKGSVQRVTWTMAGNWEGPWWMTMRQLGGNSLNPVSHARLISSSITPPLTSFEITASGNSGNVGADYYGIQTTEP